VQVVSAEAGQLSCYLKLGGQHLVPRAKGRGQVPKNNSKKLTSSKYALVALLDVTYHVPPVFPRVVDYPHFYSKGVARVCSEDPAKHQHHVVSAGRAGGRAPRLLVKSRPLVEPEVLM
jgi:hypothetical protein